MANMEDDSVTEVTTQGLGSRLMDSIKGVLIGLILIPGSIGLLFWNEGRTVHTAKGLEEAGGNVISVSSDSINQGNAGKLIHVTGNLTTDDILKDQNFGISAKGIHLKRSVTMYQWVQKEESKTEKKVGGSTETTKKFTYEKDWSSSHTDSSKFKKPEGHTNPTMPYKDSSYSSTNVQLGAFKLSPELVSMVGGGKNMELNKDSLNSLPADIKGKTVINDNSFYISQKGVPNPSTPEIGDVKVSFELTSPGPVSVIGVQTGNTFTPYTTGKDTTVFMLQNGTHTSDAMIKGAQSGNSMMAWILRAIGLIAMTAGFSMIFKPISTLGDVIPFIGSAMEFGFGLIAFIVSFVISMIVIAIAWIVYRPLLAIALLAVAAGGIASLIYMKKKKAATAAAA
jgi:hypothetical protein